MRVEIKRDKLFLLLLGIFPCVCVCGHWIYHITRTLLFGASENILADILFTLDQFCGEFFILFPGIK
jgi:hypothetical protein